MASLHAHSTGMSSFLQSPLSLAFMPTLPCPSTDEPILMPSLADQTCPRINQILFDFPDDVIRSSEILRRCTSTMSTIDHIVQMNGIHRNTCLILQAGAQASMRLSYYVTLPRNWNSLVEVPFCLALSKTGRCPRALDAEHLALAERWLTLLSEVLQPFQNVSPSQLDAIAPSHMVSRSVNDDMLQHHPNATTHYHHHFKNGL